MASRGGIGEVDRVAVSIHSPNFTGNFEWGDAADPREFSPSFPLFLSSPPRPPIREVSRMRTESNWVYRATDAVKRPSNLSVLVFLLDLAFP